MTQDNYIRLTDHTHGESVGHNQQTGALHHHAETYRFMKRFATLFERLSLQNSPRWTSPIARAASLLLVGVCLLTGQIAKAQITNDSQLISTEAGGGGGIIKGADGTFYVWGKGAFNSGNPNKNKYRSPALVDLVSAKGEAASSYPSYVADYLEPLTPANGFAYTGTLVRAICAGQVAGDNRNAKRILLTTTGLWYMNYGVYWNGSGSTVDVATPNDGIGMGGVASSIDLRQVNLPVGVLPANVTYVDWVSQGDQANLGFVYIIANGKVYYTAATTTYPSGGFLPIRETGTLRPMPTAGL